MRTKQVFCPGYMTQIDREKLEQHGRIEKTVWDAWHFIANKDDNTVVCNGDHYLKIIVDDRMEVYKKMNRIYWQIRMRMVQLNCIKVPHFICNEMPNIIAKQQIMSFAKKLGLKTDGQGTMRLSALAPEFNSVGEKLLAWFPGKKYEVYLHCCHKKNGYFSARDSRNMLTLGFYTGS